MKTVNGVPEYSGSVVSNIILSNHVFQVSTIIVW